MRTLAVVTILAACSACPGGGGTYPQPKLDTFEQVKTKLEAGRNKAKTFRALTLSDYWLGNKRIKGDVKMMGTPGSKVRFNALSPAGGSVLLDLACDGTNYVLIDNQNNCALTGPCTGESIAQLIHVPLEPDDFFYLAVGQTPVLDGANGTVTWDSKRGYEVVQLTGASGSQTIEIDMRNGQYDIAKSEMRDATGTMRWTVENKGFAAMTGADDPPTTMRVPGTSRFQAPGQHSDVIVEWKERDLNAELPEQAFVLPNVAGLPTCAQHPPP